MVVTIRQELGKGMQVGRQDTVHFIDPAGTTRYAVACVPRVPYNVTKLEFYSGVKVAAGANTVDVYKDTGSLVEIMAQFDPDTLTAGAAPTEKTVLGAGKNIPKDTPIVVKFVAAAGSATSPPDLSVTVHWEPALTTYGGEVPYGTYEK